MSHRDLPAERTAYDNFYDHDGAAENPFGQEALAERRPNSALQYHLSLGGSITTFNAIREIDEAAARARLLAVMDAALQKVGARS